MNATAQTRDGARAPARRVRLALGALVTATLGFAGPLGAAEATCALTVSGDRIDGPCIFTARPGGSFDIEMSDGRLIGGARTLSLDVLRPGIGALRDNRGRSLGAATRQDSDRACWQTPSATVCVRAGAKASKPAARPSAPDRAGMDHETSPPAASLPMVVTGRCHMDGCWWVRVEAIEQIGEGTAHVPGRRLRVKTSGMSADLAADGENYAALATPDSPRWQDEGYSQFFCSRARPAFLDERGKWQVLNLAQIGGATEGISNIYLHLCHHGVGDDPYATAEKLGYRAPLDGRESYPTFSELIR